MRKLLQTLKKKALLNEKHNMIKDFVIEISLW